MPALFTLLSVCRWPLFVLWHVLKTHFKDAVGLVFPPVALRRPDRCLNVWEGIIRPSVHLLFNTLKHSATWHAVFILCWRVSTRSSSVPASPALFLCTEASDRREPARPCASQGEDSDVWRLRGGYATVGSSGETGGGYFSDEHVFPKQPSDSLVGGELAAVGRLIRNKGQASTECCGL